MNQILFTGEKNSSIKINKIIIVFCAIISIFAVCLISKGIYGLMQEGDGENVQSSQSGIRPDVDVTAQGTSATIKIKHNIAINSVFYSLNNGVELEIDDVNGKNAVEKTVQLLNEDTTLKIKIIDNNKNEYTVVKEFKYDSSIDTEDPKLEVASVVKISQTISAIATDNDEISHIIYKWDDGEETIVKNDGGDKKKMEAKINLQEGKKKLSVTAVDKSGNKTSQQMDVVIVTPPEVELKRNKGELIIRTKDNEGVAKVVYEINGNQFTKENNNEDKKEFEIRELLSKGENIVKVTVYNIRGVITEKIGKCTY